MGTQKLETNKIFEFACKLYAFGEFNEQPLFIDFENEYKIFSHKNFSLDSSNVRAMRFEKRLGWPLVALLAQLY